MAKNENIYYIGFNANNAICNERFFKGSITIYPNGESGNIFYSHKKLKDIKSDKFIEKYRQFVENQINEIIKNDKKARFLYFNEKSKKLCINIEPKKIINNNSNDIVSCLNNKFYVRNIMKENNVPILEYLWFNGDELNYDDIKKKILSNKFVLQAEIGAGGNETFLIENKQDLELILKKKVNYCVSKYVKHLPINVTLVVGKKNYISFPLSTQLIKLTDKKFKYVGGDFIDSQALSSDIKNKIKLYNDIIVKIAREKGYKGILGIDYLLYDKDQIVFMEINPRFQASSFLININLEKKYGTNLAELHYLAISNKKLPEVNIEKIDESFVNCTENEQFSDLKEGKVIKAGYFKDNPSSVYRKIFTYSIAKLEKFERIDNI